MKLLIWGATPLGAYLTAHCRFLEQDALWLADDATVTAIQRSGGIQAMGARGRRFARGVRVTANAEEALAHDYDAMFFVMPVYATADALYSLRKHSKKRPTVVSLQRGIGGSERIASVVGAENVIRGALTTWVDSPLTSDAHSPMPEVFVRMPLGGIGIAQGHRLSEEIAALLYAAYFPVMLGDGRSMAWSALLWQLQANAIPALLDMPADDVYNSPSLWPIEYRMLTEALGIIQALKIRLVDLPDAPVSRLANQLQMLPPELLASRIIRNPAPPSLKTELLQRRDRSEAAYLNGAIALHANDLKLTAPINYVLALTLEDIASGRAVWSQFQHNPRALESIVNIATNR